MFGYYKNIILKWKRFFKHKCLLERTEAVCGTHGKRQIVPEAWSSTWKCFSPCLLIRIIWDMSSCLSKVTHRRSSCSTCACWRRSRPSGCLLRPGSRWEPCRTTARRRSRRPWRSSPEDMKRVNHYISICRNEVCNFNAGIRRSYISLMVLTGNAEVLLWDVTF